MNAHAYKRAVVALVGERDRAPRNAEIALALAEALLRLARHTPGAAERAKLLERAIKADPYDARPRLQLGLARGRLGDSRGALAAVRAAVALEPDAAGGALALALASLAELRDRPNKDVADKAIEAFDKLLAANPEPAIARLAHAGKLVAATHAPVVGPKPNRLGKLLPATLAAIEPTREWVPFMGYLGTAMAFAAYYRRVQLKGAKADELAARKKMLDAIAAGMAKWTAAFPDAPQLAVVTGMLAILRADEAGLPAAIAAAKLPPRLLHLVVRQRLEELDADKRVALLTAVDQLAPLASGLDRELVLSINASARAAICRGDQAAAGRAWQQAIARDPYNPALHHNLALHALSRRDASTFTAHLETTVDLVVSYWLLRDGNSAALAKLAAKHESFALRLRKTIEASLDAAEGQVAPSVVGAWCGEAFASIVLGRIAQVYRDKLPPADVLEQLVPYLRRLPAVFEESIEPPAALVGLVDPPLSGPPPLHYDTLGVPPDAAPSAIHRRYTETIEELKRSRMRAVIDNESELTRLVDAKIARLEAAFEVLSDPVRRKQYDADCIPLAEHEYNLKRRRFISDLCQFGDRLLERNLGDAVPILCAAYLQVPHDNIDPYFEALRPDQRMIYRREMLRFRYQPLLARVDVHMKKKEWGRALELLRVALAAGGARLRMCQYLTAVCEYKVEDEYLTKHRKLSGPSTPMQKDLVRARFKALPEDKDATLRELLRLMQQQASGDEP